VAVGVGGRALGVGGRAWWRWACIRGLRCPCKDFHTQWRVFIQISGSLVCSDGLACAVDGVLATHTREKVSVHTRNKGWAPQYMCMCVCVCVCSIGIACMVDSVPAKIFARIEGYSFKHCCLQVTPVETVFQRGLSGAQNGHVSC